MPSQTRLQSFCKQGARILEFGVGVVVGCVVWMVVTLGYSWSVCLDRQDIRGGRPLRFLVSASMTFRPASYVAFESSFAESELPKVRLARDRYYPGHSVGGKRTLTVVFAPGGRPYRLDEGSDSAVFDCFAAQGVRIKSNSDAETVRRLRQELLPVQRSPIGYERWSSTRHERGDGEWRLSIEHNLKSRRFYRVRVARDGRILDGRHIVEPLNGATP